MKKILLLLGISILSLNNSAFGYDIYDVPDNPPYTYQFNVYKPEEDKECTREYPLSHDKITSVFQAGINWKDILITNQINPVIYTLKPINDYNAYASSNYVTISESPYKVTQVNAVLNNRTITSPETDEFDGHISIGISMSKDFIGWSTDTAKTALYQGFYADLISMSLHEIMHSLGLTTAASEYGKEQGDKTIYFSGDINDPLSIHDYNLRIYTGNPDEPFVETNELQPENGMALGEKGFDAIKFSPYFVGENTLKVLTGENDADTAKTAIINNGGLANYSFVYENNNPEETIYPKVYGLPIHPSDEPKKLTFDLSHIELKNSFMSHQEFRNWIIPMEAELAYLQDIGYNIELRKHFGKSYYLNNITDTYNDGYSKWDGTAYTSAASQVDQGVGIHIYGNNNNITQATNDIFSTGQGSTGVRIEGFQNTYTLDGSANIITNGDNSIGLAATWGKGHTINVSEGSSVIANGANGIAVSFDFGGSIFGKSSDIKGSYINYYAEDKKNTSPDLETQGALIDNFNLSGTLEGKNAAIYISDNAYVKNININNNSVINGNIISKWNSVISGAANVLRKNDKDEWVQINPENIEEVLFTDLNFSENTIVNGNIDGSNDYFNTLIINNSGTMDFKGTDISAYILNNTGSVYFNNTDGNAELNIQNNSITGNGLLVFSDGINLNGINHIENTVDIGSSFISALDGKKEIIDISKLNSDNGGLLFDYGDTFVLRNASDDGKRNMTLKQIYINESDAKTLNSTDKIKIFKDATPSMSVTNTLDIFSSANFYYENNKYTFSQNNTDKTYLSIIKNTGAYELADAIADSTAANYIVSENETITKDLDTIQGKYFEISGGNIDIAGHKGLIADGSINKKTILKTNIYGASDSNIKLKNNANMFISAATENDSIYIGKNNETALIIDNSYFEADANKHDVKIDGEIKGINTNTNNIIFLSGNKIDLNKVDNVLLETKAEKIYINNTLTNTIWQINNGIINISKDSYLADGSNELIINGGTLNFLNNKASNIKLSNMEMKNNINMSIDIDLKTMESDRLVFNNQHDLNTNNYTISIKDVHILNFNSSTEKEKYFIPFVSSEYNNQNLISSVNLEYSKNLLTPIFKYKFNFKTDNDISGFVLSRGSSSDYNNFNTSVFSASYGAQLGGFFNQLTCYDMGFSDMDNNMLLPENERTSLKYRNKYAYDSNILTYDANQLPQEHKSLWFRPYSTFEKVNFSGGGTVENIGYGSYFGGNSEIFDLPHGWNAQYLLFAGYNGSHQRYDSVSVYQNGGSVGAGGYFYKGRFFTGLTASIGASNAQGSNMYGNEEFTMLTAGIASKTGYNWELAKGKFIIQPNYLMSYSFVNTFDYTNAAGVKITSDPLHAIQIAPGIKFIANLKNGWQPYFGVTMIWNIMDNTKFKANNTALPQMSIDPYIQYGVGLKKKWKDRFDGFIQAMINNGGRNGITITAGLSWKLGK